MISHDRKYGRSMIAILSIPLVRLGFIIYLVCCVEGGTDSFPFEPNDLNTTQLYSSHHCIGGHDMQSRYGARTCVFYNVCHIKGSGDTIEYYTNPKTPRMPIYAEKNKFFYDFGVNFVTLGPYPHLKVESGPYSHSKLWAPKVVNSPLPNFEWEKASRVIFYQSYCEFNPAEFMNLLIAIYTMPLLHGYESSTDIKLLDQSGVKRRSKHRQQLLYKGLTDYDPVYLKEEGNICYKKFFVGAATGHFSVLNIGFIASMIIEKMRDFMLENLHIPRAENPRKHRIVIFKKNTVRVNPANTDTSGMSNNENHITNIDSVVEFLSKEFEGIVDEVINFLPDDYTWSEQIKIIQSATVIITAPGGGGFGAIFARPGSSLIVLDRRYSEDEGSARFRSGPGMEDSVWTHMRTISLFHYPICKSKEMIQKDQVVVMKRMKQVVVMAMVAAERHFLGLNNRDRLANMSMGGSPQICSIFDN